MDPWCGTQAAPGRVAPHGSGQYELAAPVGFLREPQVFRPEWRPAGREVVDHVVEQGEVRHTLTCLSARSA
jgi:hypothetical protein